MCTMIQLLLQIELLFVLEDDAYNAHTWRKKDFWSGPAVTGMCEVCTQFCIMNFIKSPKKWAGQKRTSRTGSYAGVNKTG